MQRVHRTQAGNYFVKFENTPRPFDGFKLVIYAEYAKQWFNLAGGSPYLYENKTIRVHGLIKNHQDWGLEIIVNSPDVIQIVDPAAPDGEPSPVRRPIIFRDQSPGRQP